LRIAGGRADISGGCLLSFSVRKGEHWFSDSYQAEPKCGKHY